jgi:hypothetical protein
VPADDARPTPLLAVEAFGNEDVRTALRVTRRVHRAGPQSLSELVPFAPARETNAARRELAEAGLAIALDRGWLIPEVVVVTTRRFAPGPVAPPEAKR